MTLKLPAISHFRVYGPEERETFAVPGCSPHCRTCRRFLLADPNAGCPGVPAIASATVGTPGADGRRPICHPAERKAFDEFAERGAA